MDTSVIEGFRTSFIMKELKERIDDLYKYNYIIRMGIQILFDRMKG